MPNRSLTIGCAASIAAVVLISACSSASTSGAQAEATPGAGATTSPASTQVPTASPSADASPSAPPDATPTVTAGGSTDPTRCPAYADGQHPLGSPGPPGAGVHVDPTLDWTGCGSLTLPPGSARFMTGDSWQLAFAATCPNELDYGEGGMGPNVTFNEVLLDGTVGPDSQSGAGPWTDGGVGLMAHGGNYQIRVTALDPRCRWHVRIYPS